MSTVIINSRPKYCCECGRRMKSGTRNEGDNVVCCACNTVYRIHDLEFQNWIWVGNLRDATDDFNDDYQSLPNQVGHLSVIDDKLNHIGYIDCKNGVFVDDRNDQKIVIINSTAHDIIQTQ
ncbi:MAG: hypothetical protein GY928_33780 [Colwellia sp.]|nr:hypothetical protein [Colwellia sp.]